MEENFPTADKFVNNLFLILKSPLREGIFKDTVPNIPLTSLPTITKWGHGLTYVFIYINIVKILRQSLIILTKYSISVNNFKRF